MLVKRLWAVRNDSRFRDKIIELVTDFCLEASVLVSVLGILDSAVATGGVPKPRVFLLSLLVGGTFFGVSCILQASRVSALEKEEAYVDLRDS